MMMPKDSVNALGKDILNMKTGFIVYEMEVSMS